MFEYLLKRLLLALFALVVISLFSYVMLRLAPGDPTKSEMLGGGADLSMTKSDRNEFSVNEALRKKLHLDKPIIIGFALWLKQAVIRGDLGESAVVEPGRPVTELIAERLPITIKLNVFSIIVIYLVAIPIGVHTARHAGKPIDKLSTFTTFALYSLPGMWVALLLQAFLCEGGVLPIFPLKGIYPRGAEKLSVWSLQWQSFLCYFLPVLCISYGGLASLSRYARSSMRDVLDSDFIRTARAKGVSENGAVWCHAFRNSLITLITLLGGMLPGLIGGSIIIENVFSIPGMGCLAMLALSSRDYPLQMALFLFSAMLTLAGNLLADLLYVATDPRIRLTDK